MHQKILVPLVLCSFFTTEIFGASFLRGLSIASFIGRGPPIKSYCGYKLRTKSGSQEFSLLNHLYDRKDLTYTISQYTDQISSSTLDNIFAQAFNAWAEVTDLRFTRAYSGPADIAIHFVVGDHGDGNPFDGRGNVLAHATYGWAHFDDSEYWSTGLDSGVTNLYSVAVHEIGHVLGLDHSDIKRTMMYPSYDPYNVVMELHEDDINGIQRLYGEKTTSNNGDTNAVDGDQTDCWTTGCQPNNWAVVGCEQYGRSERSKSACGGGYMYECCSGSSNRKEPTDRSNTGSWSECWTTGCQLNSWASVGCQQYGMSQVGKSECPGGHLYKCCK